VSWALLLVPLFSKEGLGLLCYDAPPVQAFALLASVLGLTGSAFTVIAIVDGRLGIRALASRLVRWRVGVQWYLLAIFGLLIVGLVALSIVAGFGSIGGLRYQGTVLLGYLVNVVVGAALVHLWEDTGWIGFMFTRLQPRSGALLASLLVGPCLGGIHLPLLFISDALTTGTFPPSQYPIVILRLLAPSVVPFLALAAWLYNCARGSLIIVALFHSSLDAVDGLPLLSRITYYEFLGALAVVVALLLILARGRLGYKPDSLDLLPAPR
jgi:uncharacterized protein